MVAQPAAGGRQPAAAIRVGPVGDVGRRAFPAAVFRTDLITFAEIIEAVDVVMV